MSLFKRGNKWHFAFRFNGKRYRGSCKTPRAQEARKVESLVLAARQLDLQAQDLATLIEQKMQEENT